MQKNSHIESRSRLGWLQRQRAYAFAALTSATTVQLIEWARPELAFLKRRPQEIGMARLGARPRLRGCGVRARRGIHYCAPKGLSGSADLRPGAACFKAGRKSRNDEDDKFSLPTGSSLTEDIFKVAPRGFITDVEFDCGGLKFVSRDQAKR